MTRHISKSALLAALAHESGSKITLGRVRQLAAAVPPAPPGKPLAPKPKPAAPKPAPKPAPLAAQPAPSVRAFSADAPELATLRQGLNQTWLDAAAKDRALRARWAQIVAAPKKAQP